MAKTLGARSKLTADTQTKIVQALRAGNYRKAACQFAGIGESTLYRWLEQGEADQEANVESVYREFLEAVNRTEAEAQVEAVAMIRKAMPEDWRAAAHYLERRYPALWGRKQAVELTGADSGPLQVVVEARRRAEAMSREELDALLLGVDAADAVRDEKQLDR
jgi:hypothetical protein